MDNDKAPFYWLGLPNAEPVTFAELAKRMAAAQFPGDTDRAALERAVAEGNIAEHLARMVAEHRLAVRNPHGLTPLDAPMGEQLRRAVLLPRDLEPLGEEFGIEPPPCFVREAQPRQVPPELLKLPPDALVRWQDPTWRDSSGAGQCSAGELRSTIEERMARQAKGLYTVREAAEVLAEHRAGTEPKEWADAMRKAGAEQLPIRNPSTRLPVEPDATSRDFLDVVRGEDVDAWLQRTGTAIRFPGGDKPDGPTVPDPPAIAQTTPSASDWIAEAQSAARAIIKRERDQDRYPPQWRIADEVAADLRARGVVGPNGPLTGATIKRHALKGIGSAAAKAQSTTHKRGK